MNTKKKGNQAEEVAVNYLVGKGYKIIDRNYYSSHGEIDIIAEINDAIVFVEVKYRKSLNYGLPRDAVNIKKLNRIIFTAQKYISTKCINDKDVRIDVIEITGSDKLLISHLENVFL